MELPTKSERAGGTIGGSQHLPKYRHFHHLISYGYGPLPVTSSRIALAGSPLAPAPDSQTAALKQLADIFQNCTKRSPLLIANELIINAKEVHRDQAGAATRVNTNPNAEPTLAPTPSVPTTRIHPGCSTHHRPQQLSKRLNLYYSRP
jgi:hypothetical protein